MNTSQGVLPYKKPVYAIEWKLLVFLILFMDVKLAVKAFAIIFIYFLQPDFKFGFRIKNSRLPLFYLIVILIAILNFTIYPDISGNYLMVVFTGILIWVACILAIHQIKLFIDRTDIVILHNTLLAFFVLNIAFSLFNLFAIFMEIGFRNPFLYQGQYQKYFINSGDFIKGITSDTSTTNALINCFGIIYFIYQKKYTLVLACMATLLMTASNFSNIILTLVLTALFIFKSTKVQKSIITACIILQGIFFAKLSPQNDDYVTSTINKFILKKSNDITTTQKVMPVRERPDSLLTPESRKEKIAVLFLDSLERTRLNQKGIIGKKAGIIPEIRPQIPQDRIHTASFQSRIDTTMIQRQLLSYIHTPSVNTDLKFTEETPGKILGFRQSFNFLKDNENRIITGDGIGNFSSKLAYRATGLKIAGAFPKSFIYSNADFLNNHLSLYAYFFTKPAESHSLIHNPASVYDQLLTEYGFIGFFAFLIYYIGFFFRHPKKLSY